MIVSENVTKSVSAGTTNLVPITLPKGKYLLTGYITATGEMAGSISVSFSGNTTFSTMQTAYNNSKSIMSANAIGFVDVYESERTVYLRVYHNQTSNLSVTEAKACAIRLK